MFDAITFEAGNQLHVAAPALLIPEDRETAWAGAADYVTPRDDFAWLMGRFVKGDSYNTNGHWFPAEDLPAAYKRIPMTPLNMLHRKNSVFGVFAAAELMHPEMHTAGAKLDTPTVEALAAFWKYHFPDEYRMVQRAHDMGASWFSMEAVAETLQCMTDGCCDNKSYPYRGVRDGSYCDALNTPRSKKILHKPYFVGGAIVVPPYSPGWKDADITEMAGAIDQHPEAAERLLAAVADATPELDVAAWETTMAMLLAGAFDDNPERRKLWNLDWDVALAEHNAAVAANTPRQSFHLNLPASRTAPSVDDVRRIIDAVAASPTAGVIVAVVPPPEICVALAELGTEPVDEMHCTLAYLGKTNPDGRLGGDDDAVTVDHVKGAVAAFAHGVPPIPKASLQGTGTFAIPDGEVTYASVDAPGLNELRARLVATFAAADIDVDMTHGLSPHITLAYHQPGEGPDTDTIRQKLAELEPFPIGHLCLWWGDDRSHYQMAGGAVPLADTLTSPDINTIGPAVDDVEAVIDWEAFWDRSFSSEQRFKMAKTGTARPDGSYPIANAGDLRNAIRAVGRSKPADRDAVKAHIRKRAKALGLENLIPDNW